MLQNIIRHLVVLATLITCVKAQAFLTVPLPIDLLDNLETLEEKAQIEKESKQDDLLKPAPKNINRILSTVQVSRDHAISPLRLCHDGRYLYFKDSKNCHDYFIPGFDCDSNPALTALRSSEKIYLSEKGGDFITRFFHIDTRYYYQEVDVDSGLILKNERRRIPFCKEMKRKTTINVITKRVVRSKEEKIFVSSLVDQSKKNKEASFLILNSPIGNVDEFELFDANYVEDQIGKPLSRFPVKTPFCSGVNPDLVWQMSGEYTGGGSRSLKPASLQLISQPMFIKKKIFVVDEETKKLEQRYEFTCDPVWEI